MIFNRKLLVIFILILSLISCNTLNNKKPVVKKPATKFVQKLSKSTKTTKNKKFAANKTVQYHSTSKSILPKDIDKAFKNFSMSAGMMLGNMARSFQIEIRNLAYNIGKGLNSFWMNIKKFFHFDQKSSKSFNFTKWWNDFYYKYFKKK